MTLRGIVIDVANEMARQDKKFGPKRHLPSTLWGVVLGEEYGETCEAILDAHFDPSAIPHLREELIQVIAVSAATQASPSPGGTR